MCQSPFLTRESPMSPTTTTDSQVRIERVILAPPSLVFRAWTDPEALARWFAPRGCTIRFQKLDIRAGGRFHSCILTPGGHECWCIGTYSEIDEPRRIVFSMISADSAGNAVPPAQLGMDPDWPAETLVTVTFEDLGGKTRLCLKQTVAESVARRTGAHPSWLDMLDRLAEQVVRA